MNELYCLIEYNCSEDNNYHLRLQILSFGVGYSF